jgi:Fe2+ transport system protein FeoA
MTKSLALLPIGQKGYIQEITTDYVTKERLESLGLIQGVEIRTIRKSPLGSPKIYQCLNTLVALRNEIAGQILVEVSNEHK